MNAVRPGGGDPARDRQGRFSEMGHGRAEGIDLSGGTPDTDPVESARRIEGGLASIGRFERVEMDESSTAMEIAVVQAAMDRIWSGVTRSSPLDGIVFAERAVGY